jgi:hypothetical protein
MAEVYHNGRNTFLVDGDSFLGRYVGDMSAEDARISMKLILGLVVAMAPQPAYALADVSQVGSIPAAARRVWIDGFNSPNQLAIIVLCGASLGTQTLAKMVMAVTRLMGGREIPLVFVRSEEEGRRAIAAHRASHGARPPH